MKISDDELLTRGRLRRLLGGDARQRDGVFRLARSMGCDLTTLRRLPPHHADDMLVERIITARRLELRLQGAA